VIIGANFLFVISNILVEGTEIVELSCGFLVNSLLTFLVLLKEYELLQLTESILSHFHSFIGVNTPPQVRKCSRRQYTKNSVKLLKLVIGYGLTCLYILELSRLGFEFKKDYN